MRRLLSVFPPAVLLAAHLLFAAAISAAQTAPAAQNGRGGLRLCSQNLARLGSPQRSSGKSKGQGFKGREEDLLLRIVEAQCDILAVQEVYGESKEQAQEILDGFAAHLASRSGKLFKAYLGESFDPEIRNGFLVSSSAGRLDQVLSLLHENLPKLQPLGPSSSFIRAPLGIIIRPDWPRLGCSGAKRPDQLFIVNIHFKSKADSFKDPTGTKFETVRMEMAAGLLNIVRRYQKKLGRDAAIIVLGDRNSEQGSASTEVLSGERALEEFSRGGGCKLDDRLQPLCEAAAGQPPVLVGLLARCSAASQKQCQGGSYYYKGEHQLIDEILVPPADLPLYTRDDGSVAAGFIGRFYKGSDHRLLWADLDPCRLNAAGPAK